MPAAPAVPTPVRPLPRTRVVLLAGLAGAAVLTSGCSLGRSEFNGNRPDPSASQEEVVRTPSPVGTDLPYTQPPVRATLPGPTGGAPGQVPTTALPASPGQGTDSGSGSAGN